MRLTSLLTDSWLLSVKYPLYEWQAIDPSSRSPSVLREFCNFTEVNSSAPAHGWGLDHALTYWSALWSLHGYYNGTSYSTFDWAETLLMLG